MLLAALSLSTAAFAAPPVADDDLSEMRGGFALPGGIDVAMAVQTETSVNGALLLRSVYRLDQGAPTLQVYAPRTGEQIRGQSVAVGDRTNVPGAVSVAFDRQNGVSISRALPTSVGSVAVGSGKTVASDAGPPLDLSNGPVETAAGRVSVSPLALGVRSRIEGDGIDASHVFGAAFGSVVANTANERVVESATTLMLDLKGATPMNLGSAVLRAEALAADSVRQMVTR
jgi:hypothetical protein